MKLVLSLTENLTDPNSKIMEIAHVHLEEDRFVSFEWLPEHPQDLGSELLAEVLAALPQIIEIEINEDWPRWKASQSELWHTPGAVRTINNVAEYMAWVTRYSSVTVSKIEY